jgi:hypothetical protein
MKEQKLFTADGTDDHGCNTVFIRVDLYHNVRGSRILNKISGRASQATGIFNHGWHGLTRIRKPNPKSTNHGIGIRTIGQPEYWFYPDRIREIRG